MRKKYLSKKYRQHPWEITRKILLSIFFFLTILAIAYKWLNPPITPLMGIRFFDQLTDNRDIVFQKDRVNIEDMSKNAIYAVFAGEDRKFLDHFGFDFEALYNALEQNIKSKSISVGGSTISQQTAKNVFLRPGRSFLRKGIEAYFTLIIETFRSKKRILEVYLNVIEFGDGIYGIEAASQHYFKKPASKLTASQAALLSAMLPNPRYYEDNLKDYWLLRRKNNILRNMNTVKRAKDSKEFIGSLKE